MIRANLLPRDKRGAMLFGVQLDLSDLWRVLIATGFALTGIIVIWLGFTMAIARQDERLDFLNADLAKLAPQTNDVGQLSSNVERLKTIDRDAIWIRHSGQTIALRMAYLGNAVPDGIWLDRLAQDSSGWSIDGGGHNLESVSRLLQSLSATSPGLRTSFQDVQNHLQYQFKATITDLPANAVAPAKAGAKNG